MKVRPATRAYSQGVRAQSAEATAQRIVDAFLAQLMAQWFDEITLDSVAEGAGVTVQTVVRRFGGKEGLLAAAVKVFAAGVDAQRGMPSGDVEQLVDSLLRDYEQTGDAVIRLLALGPRHPAVDAVLQFGRGEHRKWVSDVLCGPLSKLEAPERQRAVDALVITTDVYTWKLLRRDMGRSLAATKQTLTRLIQATMTEFSTNP
jgi:AcrR family transcriptional regulator